MLSSLLGPVHTVFPGFNWALLVDGGIGTLEFVGVCVRWPRLQSLQICFSSFDMTSVIVGYNFVLCLVMFFVGFILFRILGLFRAVLGLVLLCGFHFVYDGIFMLFWHVLF